MFLDMLNRTRMSAHEERLPVARGCPDVVVQLESSTELLLFEFGWRSQLFDVGSRQAAEAATWIKSNVATLQYLASTNAIPARCVLH